MTDQPHLPNIQPQPTSSAQDAARDAERAAYLERLRVKLQDPEFRAIEGFPIGEDEDILALSDPPYYTACPNPFLPEIITRWQEERAQTREELGLLDDRRPVAVTVWLNEAWMRPVSALTIFGSASA